MPVSTDLISILLPVRLPFIDEHGLAWLIESIQSLQSQSWEDYELLVIGPSAVTQQDELAVLQESLPESVTADLRIKFLNRQGTGIVDALNTGLRISEGQFIARMDADDTCDPARLRIQKQFLDDHPEIGICGAHIEVVANGLELAEGTRQYTDWLNSVSTADQISTNIFIESPLPHPTWMLRRAVANELQGYRNVEWAEDYDFLLRAYLHNIAMAKPDGVLLQWRDHPARLTRCDTRYSRKGFIKAKAWALSQSLVKHREVIILGTGSNALTLHDELEKRNVSVAYFVDIQTSVKGRTKRQVSVIDYEELPSIVSKSGAIMLSVVTQFGARKKLRNWFNNHNYTELTDYVFVG